MAVTKLSCPECGTVLRPAKPVAAGKKVKCPECDNVFTAGANEPEDEVEERGAKKKKAKAGKGAKAAKKPGDDDEGAYTFQEDKDKGANPKIEYAPDTSIKDLRGPAVVLLMPPANKLTMA